MDGQNLFHAAKVSFGYEIPNYDPLKLAQLCADAHGWTLETCRFYTGVPSLKDKPFWHYFWSAKIRRMTSMGVACFRSRLLSRELNIRLPDGSTYCHEVHKEVGVDVKLAVDVLAGAHRREFSAVLIFSQDQDLHPLAAELQSLGKVQGQKITIVSAFPHSEHSEQEFGIFGTRQMKISKEDYDRCLDPYDYETTARRLAARQKSMASRV